MDVADYFGDVAAPVDESETDAANDLTFGNTDDVAAGDPESDDVWKPNHEALAAVIENEKEALLRGSPASTIRNGRAPQETVLGRREPALDSDLAQSNAPGLPDNPTHAAANGNPLDSASTNDGRQHLGHEFPNLMETLRGPNLQPAPPGAPVPGVTPQPGMLMYQQMSPGYLAQLHQQQQAALLQQHMLAQHHPSMLVHHHQYFQQQAQVHQALLMQHRQRQLEQQQAAIQGVAGVPGVAPGPGTAAQGPDLKAHLPAANAHPGALSMTAPSMLELERRADSQPAQRSMAHGTPHRVLRGARTLEEVERQLTASTSDSASSGSVSHQGHGPGSTPADARKQIASETAAYGSRHESRAPDPKTRMEEIERQMAAAGLGPSGKSEQAFKPNGEMKPLGRNRDESEMGRTRSGSKSLAGPAQGGRRRPLELMNDKDLEFVFRLHLRQMENEVPYVHDYYACALKESKKAGASDPFAALAKIAVGMGNIPARSKRNGPKGARPRAKSDKEEESSDGSHSTVQHAPDNVSVVEKALGTLQVWTPKAPRKLMDVSTAAPTMTASTTTASANGSATLGQSDTATSAKTLSGTTKFMLEDEAIKVRCAVEDGYDMIADIHDCARRKSQNPVEPLMAKLFAVFRLTGSTESAKEAATASAPGPSKDDSFFVRMCSFAKGRMFVSRAMALLRPDQRYAIALCVIRNLCFIVATDSPAMRSTETTDSFWTTIADSLSDTTVESAAVLTALESFSVVHSTGNGRIVTAMQSENGTRVLYAAMQRALADVSGENSQAFGDQVGRVVGPLCGLFEASLAEIFHSSESVVGVWHMCALFDALAPPEAQAGLRATLQGLLERGVVPPPPTQTA